MNNLEIVKNALHYYDEHLFKYSPFYDVYSHCKFPVSGNTIQIYSRDDKIIYSGRYEVLCCYVELENLLVWGWAIPWTFGEMITTSRRILNYALDMPCEDLINPLKEALITSRIRMSDAKVTKFIQIDILVSLACFLSDRRVVIRVTADRSQGSKKIGNLKPSETTDPFIYFLVLVDEHLVKIPPK